MVIVCFEGLLGFGSCSVIQTRLFNASDGFWGGGLGRGLGEDLGSQQWKKVYII